jgi:hypothetical protein
MGEHWEPGGELTAHPGPLRTLPREQHGQTRIAGAASGEFGTVGRQHHAVIEGGTAGERDADVQRAGALGFDRGGQPFDLRVDDFL